MTLRYEALSENGGILLDAQDNPYLLYHLHDDIVVARTIEKGERPTILNKDAARRIIREFEANGQIQIQHPSTITTKEKTVPYRYINDNDAFSHEYQLYLAGELEKKLKAKKPTLTEQVELSGYLPHEEAPQ